MSPAQRKPSPAAESPETAQSPATEQSPARPAREPLSRARVVAAAARVADEGGLPAVSMRTVGAALGVEAMSLYNHVANKQELLDDLADWIFDGIELPTADQDWRDAMIARAASARARLAAHPWGLGLIESRRSAGPALLRHHDAVLGALRAGGFSVALASHAFSAIDAYVYGFVLTEVNLPFAPGEGAAEFVEDLELPLEQYPHLAEMMRTLVIGGDYDFAAEFDDGLEVILDGFARRLERERANGTDARGATRARGASGGSPGSGA